MSANFFLLSIKADRVVVSYDPPAHNAEGCQTTRIVTSLTDLHNFLTAKAAEAHVDLGELEVFNSSTIDYARVHQQPDTRRSCGDQGRPGTSMTGKPIL
jgi:hypothetical protein